MISVELTQIYNKTTDKRIALINLAKRYAKVEGLGCKFFNSVINTMQNNWINVNTWRSNNNYAKVLRV